MATNETSLRERKKSAKGRLTKARNQLKDLLTTHPDGPLTSKNTIRRATNKVKSEYNLIEKIINALREVYTFGTAHDENIDNDTIIETLDKELEEIGAQVDLSIKTADDHLKEREEKGETASLTLSEESACRSPSVEEQRRLEVQAANERCLQMELEQKQQEEELQRLAEELELTKQRTEEARRIAALNQYRADVAKYQRTSLHADVSHTSENRDLHFLPTQGQHVDDLIESINPNPPRKNVQVPAQRITTIKLKGVELPKFSGEDKTDYESWKAAFMSIVDRADLPVNEKMLRLQNSLSGKAQTMVKDLGYSLNAYERAKSKLEKKYGGERRLMIKHLTALRELQKIRSRNLEDMEHFLVILERVMIALQDSGPGKELTGQNLNLTAKEKLPQEDVQAYKYWLIEHSREDTFNTLVEWIELRVQIMEEAREETSGHGLTRNSKPDDRRSDRREERRHNSGYSSTFRPTGCIVTSCKENHPPWACRGFKALSVTDRKVLISKSRRCYRCLAAGHQRKECPNARRCGINGCSSNQHSRYLHEHNQRQPENDPNQRQPENDPDQHKRKERLDNDNYIPPETSAKTDGAGDQDNTTTKTNSHATSQAECVSLMVLPAIITNGDKRLKVNVMLDNCSTGSYVSEAAAEELLLQGKSQHLIISGTGGSQVKRHSRQVELNVSSLDNKFSANLQASVLDNISGDTPAFEWSKLKTKWPHLESIPFQNVAKRRQIDVLIGSDSPVFHQVLKEIQGSEARDPIARLTRLGWVCFGPTLAEEFRRTSRSHFTRTYRSSQVKERETSDDILRKFWELEAIGIRDETDREFTPDEKAAVAQVTETLEFKDRRYTIGIPWKRGEPQLVNNFEMALGRLKNQEKSLLKKGPEVAKSYDQIIKDYEKKGYVTKVPKSEESNQWFLPHFPVIREDRTTTKVRMVFDAAARNNGKSLNDAIRSGPKLQRELTDVLTRFRRAPVALSGDISEMFLQVGLHEEDRRYHRFLWRDLDSTKDPDHYEFQRLLFGNRASPFCSQHVLHTHAKVHATDYPQAAETVDNSMYVDDVLDSCETVDEALHLRRELSDMLTKCSFKLRKWSSNDPAVINDVPAEDRLQRLEIQEEESPKIKTLGILWEAENDVFTFRVKPPDVNMKPTKRNVLSAISTLFDPLQFLSPFTVRAKVLMQEIWIAGVGWDDVLPDNLIAKWRKWISELPELSNVTIPRCLRQPSPSQTCLHVFSDASKEAYASVAYLVCRYPDNTASSRLVASKSRVAPTKVVTIPRLELMGAVLSTRLAKNIAKTLTVDRTIFWSDSTNVLHWIRNQSREFKPFVANRVGEIHRSTNPEQWRHIPGELNPADLPTRGLSAKDLANSKFWMEGPELVKADESTWPPQLPNDEIEEKIDENERRKAEQTHVTKEDQGSCFLEPSHFSNLQRLIHITGWMQRFLVNCRLPDENREKSHTLRPHETKRAETFWIKHAQAEAFANGEAEKSLAQLNPKKDDESVLRADGRLRNADDLPYSVRHPILLPKDHDVTRLIITRALENLGHGSGVEHALTELRSRFWIVRGRRTVRNVIEKCPGCRRRFTGKPAVQMMAPLPRSRLQHSLRAFERVGVDYGGPYMTKQGRGKTRAKRYLCLFTCLATRAVHLEMSYSLDTDSFINAFTRMVSRRGTPAYVLSDNGTNFVGAERELRELVEAFDQEKIIHKTTQGYNIEWKFNPPSAPHFGGVFESMIKSAKKAIKAILGNADISDEELHTAICGAERLLNSRPITFVSSDPADLSPLTPSHFLIGQLGGKFAPETADREEVFNPRKRWHRIQQLLGQFWKRWRMEFLPSLNARKKWFHPAHNLKEDDVVMIVEPNAKRGEWPLGRVTEVFPGSDGLIRVVRIKTKDNEYLRPVHRLCPLEYVGESS